MSEIKVGEYVRTKEGYIVKITKLLGKDCCYKNMKHYLIDIFLRRYNGGLIYQEDITKHSPNIIDLIEEGDYVNGEQITEITIDPFVKGQINLWTDVELRDVYENYERVKYTDKDIKSIVTKEQFKEVEYKVNEQK